MSSTICATTYPKGKTAFPIASRGCQRKTKRPLVKSVGTFDQKVASLELFFLFLMNWGAVLIETHHEQNDQL